MVFNQEKYNELVKFSEKYAKTHKSEIGTKAYAKVMLEKAAELGMSKEDLDQAPEPPKKISPKIYKSIMSNPNISDYDKNIFQRDIDRKTPRGCYSHQYEYIPPKGTEGYDRFKHYTDCGDHCVCVDKGVDKKSIDRINKNKSIEIAWVCDGEHHAKDPENIQMGQNIPPLKPSTIIEYKGNNRKKLKSVINSICKTSRVWEHETGLDACTKPIPKKANTFSISGRKRNSRYWWTGIAGNLDNLLDIKNNTPKKSKIKPKKERFSFG